MRDTEGPDRASAGEVVAFWREAGASRWFTPDPAFDEACRARFLTTHEMSAAGDLADWEASPEGALAVVLLLDQLPRNMFRGSRRAYQTDAAALLAAERALAKGFDRKIEPALRFFFYLPFEHAEDLAAQERAVALFREHGDAEGLRWAELHHDLVARFGRFPHRNAVLGRASTPEELAYLASPDAFRG